MRTRNSRHALAVRLAAGELMGLGDVRSKVVPKMTLIAPPPKAGMSPRVRSSLINVMQPLACLGQLLLEPRVCFPSRFAESVQDDSGGRG